MIGYTAIGLSEHFVEEPGGRMRREYEWHGDGTVAWLDWSLLPIETAQPVQRGGVLSLGRFRLRVIDVDTWNQSYRVMRDGRHAHLYATLYPLRRAVERTYYRLILTAGIWGLAQTPNGAVPSWRDIHALRWIAGCVTRRQP